MATNFWELLQQHQGDLTKSGRTVADLLAGKGVLCGRGNGVPLLPGAGV